MSSGAAISRIGALSLVVLLTMLALLPGVALAQDQKTLIVSVSPFRTLLVNYEQDGFTYYSIGNIYNKLVDTDAVTQQPIPDLAEKWDISPDGKTYTFHLRSAKWHDGKPFTSADVKWTFESLVREKSFAAIRVADVERIDTPDDRTVVMQLKAPNAAFIPTIAVTFFGFYVLPKHVLEGIDVKNPPAGFKPIGTGPFTFVEFQPGSSLTLQANADYFKGRPQIDRLIFKILKDEDAIVKGIEAREIDFDTGGVSLPAAKALEAKGVVITSVPLPVPYWIAFNTKVKPFDDARVRKAVAMSVNRDSISKKALFGVMPTNNNVIATPKSHWAYNKSGEIQYDPEKAQQLLDEAGYRKGADGTRFRTKFLTFIAGLAGWSKGEVAEVIKEDLRAIGIQVDIEIYEDGVFRSNQQLKDSYPMALQGGFHGPDPNEWRLYVTKEGFRNIMGYSHPELPALFDKGVATTDRAERAKVYDQIQQILAQDVPAVNLVDFVRLYVGRPDYEGFWFEAGVHDKVGDWRFEKVRTKGSGAIAGASSEMALGAAAVIIVLVGAGAFLLIRRRSSAEA